MKTSLRALIAGLRIAFSRGATLRNRSAAAVRQAHELARVGALQIGLAIEDARGLLEHLFAIFGSRIAGGAEGLSRDVRDGFVMDEERGQRVRHARSVRPCCRMSRYFLLVSDTLG